MSISQKLLLEIDEKLRVIEKNPEYHLKKRKYLEGSLRKLCDVYSFWLENPNLRRGILPGQQVNNNERRELKKMAREGIIRINNAWYFLSGISGREKGVVQGLIPWTVLETGRIVNGMENPGFRNTEARLGLEKYSAPDYLRIPQLVDFACQDLKQKEAKGKAHPVEIAATAHLFFAGIQPFHDGNKRVARLIQDRILADTGLPPAIIPSGEREAYIDVLEDALCGWREEEPKMQRAFFDYIGGKVNNALDEILGDLKIRLY